MANGPVNIDRPQISAAGSTIDIRTETDEQRRKRELIDRFTTERQEQPNKSVTEIIDALTTKKEPEPELKVGTGIASRGARTGGNIVRDEPVPKTPSRPEGQELSRRKKRKVGTIQGAQTGAQIGSAWGPYGAIIGAIVGGIAGNNTEV